MILSGVGLSQDYGCGKMSKDNGSVLEYRATNVIALTIGNQPSGVHLLRNICNCLRNGDSLHHLSCAKWMVVICYTNYVL